MDGLGGEILMAWKGDDESKDVEIKGIDIGLRSQRVGSYLILMVHEMLAFDDMMRKKITMHAVHS
jgi:hypothetical protein